MRALIAKYVLVATLSVGLILPMMGAVLVDLVPGVTSFVICTGEGMTVITVDAEGNPVETPTAQTGDCVFVDTGVTTARAVPFWETLAREDTVAFVSRPAAPYSKVFDLIPPSQAPPVSI